jgi:hypothetical protein
MTSEHKHITEAREILSVLGMPREQSNERSALILLALLDLGPNKAWSAASNPLMGITPIMDWAHKQYQKEWKPNTRETLRRRTMHQFVDAGIAVYNPDDPGRPVNSPKAVYQIADEVLALIRTFNAPAWKENLNRHLATHRTLAERYAKPREMKMIPVRLADGTEIKLSPGEHSELIRAIIESFIPRFAPGSSLIYAGDTGQKWAYFNESELKRLGVTIDSHGKMPDVVAYYADRNWLLLIESVTSHGPVDGKRHEELARLFGASPAGLVYVTAFPNRNIMARYLPEIAWETEVWVADHAGHLIHFNGERFLGPYARPRSR